MFYLFIQFSVNPKYLNLLDARDARKVLTNLAKIFMDRPIWNLSHQSFSFRLRVVLIAQCFDLAKGTRYVERSPLSRNRVPDIDVRF